ncbi:NAD(P)/FAD-dependent oxidoreductase [Microbulbifer sp. SSSA002]|uniref:NAD(P)/FAD-dependent oxidoreductase n=1 Tax=Microbulbifer sp. SSSA002 TaxID=3243376 RepID=UPI004039A6A8
MERPASYFVQPLKLHNIGEVIMDADVLIIGGSFAGLSAAMQLVCGCRKVVMLETNKASHGFAQVSHGVLGLGGDTPQEIHTTALSQLNSYSSFQLVEDVANSVEVLEEGFAVISAQSDTTFMAKKLILATDIADRLPDIPGIKERWGRSVIFYPDSHGYELKGHPLGVLATSDLSFQQAVMIPEWGATTLFTQGQFRPEEEVLNHLLARGVRLEETPIAYLQGEGDSLGGVILDDGRKLTLEGLYVSPKAGLAQSFVSQLGLELEASFHGQVVKVNGFKETSVKGVFAAGDISNSVQDEALAIVSGAMAGVGAHRSLISKR